MAETQYLKQFGPFDKELAVFSAMMRIKMEKNAHRGRWEGAQIPALLRHLEKEVSELKAAIAAGNIPDVMLESADIGNLAMIIMFAVMENKVGQPKRKTAPASLKRRRDKRRSKERLSDRHGRIFGS